jgi:hypothetical protein
VTRGSLIPARDVAGAIEVLGGRSGARAVAGATALLVDVARGGDSPGVLVDLTTVDELATVWRRLGATWLGAAVTLDRVAGPCGPGGVVGAASGLVATPLVRRQATIGGNICAPGWARDLVPALWCAGAVAEIAGPGGRRQVPVGPESCDLARDEILVHLVVPDGRGSAVAGGGPTPERPALRVLTGIPAGNGAGRAALCAGPWWRRLPRTGEAAGDADVAAALTRELSDLGVPEHVAAALAARTDRELRSAA